MGLFANPLGHAGYHPNVTGTPSTQPAAVRAATAAEATAGVLNHVYISPATLNSALLASSGVTAAMVAGAVTTSNAAVTASSIINYSRKTVGGTVGQVSITAQSAGSFTLTSSSATETSTFNYQIIN